MSLPIEFLTQQARSKQLSDREEQVFLKLFGSSQSRAAISRELHISESSLTTCLIGVYRKFSVPSDLGRGKENHLRDYLEDQYKIWQGKNTASAIANETDADLATLVQTRREQVRSLIQERCGTMRVLDMSQPIDLDGERGIYTNVNILERLISRRRLGIDELLKQCDSAEFERFGLGKIQEERIAGTTAIARFSKLMVLGKPGAGKTTFLKYLAIQCIHGKILSDHLPVFVTLKDFAEADQRPDLSTYIDTYIGGESLLPVLQGGKALLLLDGLDEVREEDTKRVISQIQQVAQRFPDNQFVITCRIAAKEYTFETFTEVEVADFDDEQIKTFAENWFRAKGDVDRAKLFVEKLNNQKPIKDLASSPLLLTLLCLMFEDTTSFPANRSELYKEALDTLLKKWDGKRKIERDQVYKNLSLKRKEDLLSQIALTTFENKEYFFKQRVLEDHIADFIRNLPDAKTDPAALHLDSEDVLESIEAHHGLLVERAKGIYSFSHLTFQEYFTAREIVESRDPALLEQLVGHITEPRWREVFLLTVGMLRNGDELMRLMKRQVDGLLAADPKLQQFLIWVQEKSSSVAAPYKPAAIRAFYYSLALARTLALDRARDLALDRALARALDLALALDRARDLALDRALALALALARALDRDRALALARARDLALDLDLDPILKDKLQELKDKLPDTSMNNYDNSRKWWTINGQDWVENLRKVMIEHRNIGHDWQFSKQQKELLQQYYDANKLLVDCLNSDCYISRTVREEIENTLLLPISAS